MKPREQEKIFGHEAARQAFMGAWESGNMPHSWLLTGPRGIGKASFAYHCAREVFASFHEGEARGQTPGLDMFGQESAPAEHHTQDHPVFRQVASLAHPMLQVLEADGDSGREDIAVDNVRELHHFLKLRIEADQWRVIIIDPVDAMAAPAANALLKMLEEPPLRTIFLLICHSAGRILPTIRSRCRILPMMPLSQGDITEFLRINCPKIDEQERLLITTLADGAAGQALTMHENDAGEIYEQLLDAIKAMHRGNPSDMLAVCDSVARKDKVEKWHIMQKLLARIYLLAAKMERISPHQAGTLPQEHALHTQEGEVAKLLLEAYGGQACLNAAARTAEYEDITLRLFMDRKQSGMLSFLVPGCTF